MANKGVRATTRFAGGAVANQDEYVRSEARLASQAARDPARVSESLQAGMLDPGTGVPLMRYNAGLTESDRDYMNLRNAAIINNGAVEGELGGQVMMTDRDWSLRDRLAKSREIQRRDSWIRQKFLGPGTTPERRKAARRMFPDFYERTTQEIERAAEIEKLTRYMNLHGVDNTDGLTDEECVKMGRFIYGASQGSALVAARSRAGPIDAAPTVESRVRFMLKYLLGPIGQWLHTFDETTALVQDERFNWGYGQSKDDRFSYGNFWRPVASATPVEAAAAAVGLGGGEEGEGGD